jgi:hypothetical protein
VLPVLDIWARAAHVPYSLTWAMERVGDEELEGRTFPVLARLADLPELLSDWR